MQGQGVAAVTARYSVWPWTLPDLFVQHSTHRHHQVCAQRRPQTEEHERSTRSLSIGDPGAACYPPAFNPNKTRFSYVRSNFVTRKNGLADSGRHLTSRARCITYLTQ